MTADTLRESALHELSPTVMPISLGAPMDENSLGAESIVIFTATYGLIILMVRSKRNPVSFSEAYVPA